MRAAFHLRLDRQGRQEGGLDVQAGTGGASATARRFQLSPDPGSVRVLGDRVLSSSPRGSVAGRGGLPVSEGGRRFSFSTEGFEARSDVERGAGASWVVADWVMQAQRANGGSDPSGLMALSSCFRPPRRAGLARFGGLSRAFGDANAAETACGRLPGGDDPAKWRGSGDWTRRADGP